MRHRRAGSVWGILAVSILAFSLTSCGARVETPAAPSSQGMHPPTPVAPEIDMPATAVEGVDIHRHRLDRIARTV